MIKGEKLLLYIPVSTDYSSKFAHYETIVFKNCPPQFIATFCIIFLRIILPTNATAQRSCNCPSGLNVTNFTFSIQKAITFGVLPAGGSNISCISMPAGSTLLVDADYTFNGTTFNMGSNSRILVKSPYRLILRNHCKLTGCDSTWQGVTLEPGSASPVVSPGGQLDMSDSRLEYAATGILAQSQSMLRLVSNVFANNPVGLKITGYVPFINFGNPDDFSNNTFYSPYGYAAIWFESAYHFSIGDAYSGSASVTNTLTDYSTGILVNNSEEIGIYGVTIKELYGLIYSDPFTGDRICIKTLHSRNVGVKYCTMTDFLGSGIGRPYYGIATYFGRGRHIYSNNNILSFVNGIYTTSIASESVSFDIENNIIQSHSCIDMTAMSNGYGKSVFISGNDLTYKPHIFGVNASFEVEGIGLHDIGAPYLILGNTAMHDNPAGSGSGSGIRIGDCTGFSEISDNSLDIVETVSGAGISYGGKNSKIYRNTITGSKSTMPYYTTGIDASATNVAFCCNTITESNYGTRFNSSNTDIKFYTTTYGIHDTALYFPPAATINPQFNTGNTWVGASDLLDAYYDGTLPQAQSNAPFRTDPANINSSKIIPNGWFTLTGTDPSCTQAGFTCSDITISGGFTELTDADLAALSPVGAENEYVLRFQQQRQLYRKLQENPQLVNWNQQVSNFYSAAQNGIVGAFDSLDEAFYKIYSLSPSLNQSYAALSQQIDSLGDEVSAISAQYPTATSEQKKTLLEQIYELTDEIGNLQDQVNALRSSAETEMQTQITQLLTQNSALSVTELWETNEKDINDLYFKYYGGVVDTFTATEKYLIETLALSCPQYEGVGVYKARRLYEPGGGSPAYHEHGCKPSNERSKQFSLGTNNRITVTPNPADERLAVYFGQILPEESRLFVCDMSGRILFTKEVSGLSEASVNVGTVQQGVYVLSVLTPGLNPVQVKVVIRH